MERGGAHRRRAGRVCRASAKSAIDARVLAVCARGLGRVEPRCSASLPALQASRVDLNQLASPGRPRRRARRRRLASARRARRRGDRARGRARRRRVAADPQLRRARARRSLGFSADHLLVVETSVPTRIDLRNIAGAQRATAFYADVLPRLAAVPGVDLGRRHSRAAAARSRFGHESNGGYWLEGGQDPERRRRPAATGRLHGGHARLLQDDADPDARAAAISRSAISSTRRSSHRQRRAGAPGVRRRRSDRPAASPAASTRRSS